MCGIAAIFAYDRSAPPVDEPEAIRIREAMHNRGPDGAGLWLSADRRVALAHRRLAIIDLSDAGLQPMATADGQLRVVFNGEIYNYRALRAGLEAKGYAFHSHSDTEVILHLYREYGRDFPTMLRGMFAVALWDEKAQGLLLTRGPFGVKPLYYADDGKTIRVASQVKALVAGGAVDTTPDPAGHVGFYLWGHVPEPFTRYRGIRALPAGTTVWIDRSGRQAPRPFFDMTEELVRASELNLEVSKEEMRERLRVALLDTVRHHLIADVPVGVFLSAGLDSTTLTALATEVGHGDVRTVALGFTEYRGTVNDETAIAERSAQRYGTNHTTRWVAKEEFHADYAALLAAMDQPSIDGVNSYFVSKAAAEAGLKVALSGVGGDELFGGYSSFQQIPKMVRSLAAFNALPSVGKGFRLVSASVLERFTSPKYAGILEYGGTYGGSYLLRRGLYMPWELPDLLDADFVREGWNDLRVMTRLEETMRGVNNVHLKLTGLESAWYMRNQLLRDTDWASMAHSLEVRTPLVDVELFRAVTPLIHSSTPPTKQDMASATASPLPDEVLHRPKTGFSIPVREWLLGTGLGDGSRAGHLRPWARRVIEEIPRDSQGSPVQGAGGRAPGPSRGASRRRSGEAAAGKAGRRQVALLASEMMTHGGIQSFMHRIGEVMAGLADDRKVESHLFSLNDDVPRLRTMGTATKHTTLWGAGKSKARLAARLMVTRQPYDVMIVGHVGMAPLAYALQSAGRLRSYYVQLHGIEAWRRVSRTQRLALRGATAILATTKYTAEVCARDNDIPLDRFRVIPLCAGEQLAPPSAQFKLDGAFKLLCVARQDQQERYKGFETMFEALVLLRATHPGVHLNLIGGGDDQPRLRKVAGELGVLSQVTFWGRLPDAELEAAYEGCDAFVMPSRKEGFGIVFLEAMRHGKACIGGNHGGTPDVIEEGRSGYLVEYGDVPTLAQRIAALADSPALREEMGRAGRALVEGKFSWPGFAAEYVKLLTAGSP